MDTIIKNIKIIILMTLYAFSMPLFGYGKKKRAAIKVAINNDTIPPLENTITKPHETSNGNAIINGEHVPAKKPLPPARPATATDNKGDLIEVNLEDTKLPNLLQWVSEMFDVSFLTDDAFQPKPQGGQGLAGNKVTFKTQTALTKKQVWDLFITFLDLFGLGLVQATIPNFYNVRPVGPINTPNVVTNSPINSYINIDWKDLPNNDTIIRYIYFVQNSTLGTLQSLVDAFKSTSAILKPLQDLNAFVLTDKASNIRSIMQVIVELDKLTQPEALSVLKLKNADAEDVVKIYNQLTKTEDPRGLAARILGTQKKPTSVYFPDTLRLIAERRTNTLIILGDAEGIKKVEDFIINYVDTELKVPYSPLYVYELQYTNAKDMADILTAVTKFAPNSPAAQSGGVREGDKYLQSVTFKAEEQGNRLLIRAEKEDYLKIRDIIRQLDVKQPQIAIEVLIVNVIGTDDRELGVQIRNKDSKTVSKNLDFQTSGFPLISDAFAAPVVNPDTGSLMGNLVRLAQNQTPGSTLLTIANGANGVWAIFKLLQTYARTNVVSNPFLITTNKYQASVSIGETRRVQTGVTNATQNTNSFGDVSANLTVKITPQINSIGIINLKIDIAIDNFVIADDPNSATKDTKTVVTNADIGNGEVLAIGGLLESREEEVTLKVPVLGDIPLVGWFFKNKTKTKTKDNLLVFISPRIVEPRLEGGMNDYSKEKSCKAKDTLGNMRLPAEKRDPVHRWFFKDYPCEATEFIDDFIAKRNNEPLCRIECERCPDEIDPDYVCCKETKRFITQDNDQKPANKSTIIAQIPDEHQEVKKSSETKPSIVQQNKSRSITRFLPLNNKKGVA